MFVNGLDYGKRRQHYLTLVVKDFLIENGVHGPQLIDYVSYARKVIAEALEYGLEFLPYLLWVYERIWIKKYNVDQKILRKIEKIISSALSS